MATSTIQDIYSDLDLTFNMVPGTNDVALSYDDQAVIRSLRGLLLTNYYERLFQPTVGSGITQLLFELNNTTTMTALESSITQVIQNFEPRVNLISVVVTTTPDEHGYNVTLTFFIVNATQATTLNLILQRTR